MCALHIQIKMKGPKPLTGLPSAVPAIAASDGWVALAQEGESLKTNGCMLFKKYMKWGFLLSSLLIYADEKEELQQAADFRKIGNVPQAVIHYQKALAYNPLCFEAHFNLANEFFYQNQFDDAITHYLQTMRINPQFPQIYYNVGMTFFRLGQLDQATEYMQRAIDKDDNYFKAYIQLGKIYEQQKKIELAKEIYIKLIEKDPTQFDACYSLSEIYRNQEELARALEYLKRAWVIKPNDLIVGFNVGCLCVILGKIDDAVKAFEKVLELSPGSTQALYNIGYALKMAWRVDEAIEVYKKIISLSPTYQPASFGLGMAYLQKGDFENGWKQHEQELKKEHKNSELLREFLKNNCVKDKVILLRPEGGLGDTVMFFRYAQNLKKLGAKTVAIVQKSLIPLLSRCPYIDELIPVGKGSLPACHEAATYMSLPAIFNSNEQTIPRSIPYIFPDPSLVEFWANYLKNDNNFKIGICWQADVFNDSSRPKVARRGLPLAQFYPLSQLKGISLYSLQQFDGIEQLKNIPENVKVHIFNENFDKEHGNFMDTAAVMRHLDLVITVDTAIAHIAGALGRPVWLLLPFATDWRWIAHRSDSPWYPSMKIFKQMVPFNWDLVMQEVIVELARIVQQQQGQ